MEKLRSTYLKFLKSFLIICLFTSYAYSQNLDGGQDYTFWQNVRYGGNIGLSFGDGFFSGTLAPAAVYDFQNAPFSLGLGLNGTYNSQRNVFNSTIFGGSLIGLFNPVQEVQASFEFEQLNVTRNFTDNQFADENYWYPALFIGVGYLAGNVAFGIRYDLLYDNERSIYANAYAPFVRVFF
ncbi:MAG: alpha-ketoglutarate decarboxylase [Bacteroidota bacterium]